MEDDGINGNFHTETETPTGTCAVIVKEKDRTLCANLAAACKYSPDHLANNLSALDKAKIIYTTSFFITSSNDSLQKVANYATEHSIPFAFNLSAPFLLQFELEKVLAGLEHADYVFCNEDETAAFAKAMKMPENSSVDDIAKEMANYKKVSSKPGRIAILTQGPLPVVVATNKGDGSEIRVTKYPVTVTRPEAIIDTNGAGDAFVGGFLCEMCLDKSFDDCMLAGNFLSAQII